MLFQILTMPAVTVPQAFELALRAPLIQREGGAGDATRTRDIFLGKEVLYQLSYTRNGGSGK